MFDTEETLWTVLICCLFLLLFCNYNSNSYENFDINKLNPSLVGQMKELKATKLVPIFPILAFPLSDSEHTYIVNVPLTPFKSPLIILPPIDKPFPYLCYKRKYLSPILNQGDCGCCWIIGVLTMLSDRLVIKTAGLFNDALSPQQILTCFSPDGCDGGSPEDLCIWLNNTKFGINTNKSIPFKMQQGGDIDSKCSSKNGTKVYIEPNSVKSITQFIPEKNYDPDILQKNIVNMKSTLASFGPFYCAMTVYDDLFGFDGVSIYSRNPKASVIGGHCIEIIGYCDKGIDKRIGFNKSGYWIARTSWGDWPTSSKTKGYFCIEMGTNNCGIESRCGIAEPNIIGYHNQVRKPLSLSDLRWEKYPG